MFPPSVLSLPNHIHVLKKPRKWWKHKTRAGNSIKFLYNDNKINALKKKKCIKKKLQLSPVCESSVSDNARHLWLNSFQFFPAWGRISVDTLFNGSAKLNPSPVPAFIQLWAPRSPSGLPLKKGENHSGPGRWALSLQLPRPNSRRPTLKTGNHYSPERCPLEAPQPTLKQGIHRAPRASTL